MDANPLKSIIAERIRRKGPMSVGEYMALCLTHPEHGYYMNRDPLGMEGDFVTAPEISQMFGELIGLWAADIWNNLDRPANLKLVELGPGRGTLMRDALRALNAVPGFPVDLYLVEASPALQRIQQATLPGTWVGSLDDIPPGPVVFIANEYFDALPVEQLEKADEGWLLRRVGLDTSGALVHEADILAQDALATRASSVFTEAEPGTLIEISPMLEREIAALSRRIVRDGGAALIIDYGPENEAPGETLQAVHGHAYCSPFDTPGEADLTAHVRFSAVRKAAATAGAAVWGPVPQGNFLENLGLFARAESLKTRATPSQRREIDLAAHRLTAPDQMGTLFKALAITAPARPAPAGFEA